VKRRAHTIGGRPVRRALDIRWMLKTITFGVVAAGFLTLILTGSLSVAEIAVIVLSLPAAWFWGERIAKIPRADTAATAAIILVFLLAVIGFFFFDRSFVAMTTGFLITVQAVRLLFLTEIRHYLQVYLISLFSILAATVLTFSPVFLVMFVVYLSLATAGMIVLTMAGDIQRIRGSAAGVEISGIHLARLTAGSVAFTVGMSVVIFIFFPRLSAGFLPSSIVQPVRVPGFSNNVELGEVGDLKITDETIMRVVIDEDRARELGPNVYWRGTAFDTFDGKYWEKSTTKRDTVKRMGSRFVLDSDAGSNVHQEYYLESNDSRVLFVLSRPSIITGSFRNLSVDRYGTVEMSSAVNDKVHYTVDSFVAPPGSPRDEDALTERELTAYRQLPEKLDPRIADLVSEIVGDEQPGLGKAALIRDWLLSNMSYNLNPKGVGTDPLTAFLFEERQGYCEHFATAMVVMLRVAGVPSRIVTGFLTGSYNDIGSFYIVRSVDAHAWVEVYADGYGWVPFEPTPPAGLSALGGGSVIRALFEDFMMKWNIYVVNYEMTDQIRIIEGFRNVGERSRRDVSTAGGDVRRFLAGVKDKKGALFIPVVVVASAAGAVLAGWAAWVLMRGLAFTAGRGGEVGRIYRASVRYLSRRGVRKGDATTPREFSRAAAAAHPGIGADMEELTEIYYRLRFGRDEQSDEDVEQARRILARIKRLV
jgi:transglutaminase-like putative cysteine protease